MNRRTHDHRRTGATDARTITDATDVRARETGELDATIQRAIKV
jgi:hypothetical protein